MGRKTARHMLISNTNKNGIQCICFFIHKESVTMQGHTIVKSGEHFNTAAGMEEKGTWLYWNVSNSSCFLSHWWIMTILCETYSFQQKLLVVYNNGRKQKFTYYWILHSYLNFFFDYVRYLTKKQRKHFMNTHFQEYNFLCSTFSLCRCLNDQKT